MSSWLISFLCLRSAGPRSLFGSTPAIHSKPTQKPTLRLTRWAAIVKCVFSKNGEVFESAAVWSSAITSVCFDPKSTLRDEITVSQETYIIQETDGVHVYTCRLFYSRKIPTSALVCVMSGLLHLLSWLMLLWSLQFHSFCTHLTFHRI